MNRVTHALLAGLLLSLGGVSADEHENISFREKTFLPHHIIDQHVEKVLGKKGLSLAPTAPTHIFLRRSFLDIIGRPPTPKEMDRFSEQPLETAQDEICDYLVSNEDYATYWATQWKSWLFFQNRDADFVEEKTLYFHELDMDLISRFRRTGHRIDHIAWDAMTNIEGNSFLAWYIGDTKGEAGKKSQPDFIPATDKISRSFLGTQLSCVQCHDDFIHGMYEQKDFWELNALLSNIHLNDYMLVYDEQNAKVVFETPEGDTLEALPGWRGAPINQAGPSHKILAQKVLESEEFAPAVVNRYWQHLFGYGLNHPEPYDNIDLEDDGNDYLPLLKTLAKKFEQYQYQPTELLRWICKSKAYATDSVVPEGEQDGYNYFARMPAKPLTQEQLATTFAHLTNYLIRQPSQIRHHQNTRDKFMTTYLTPIVKKANYKVPEKRMIRQDSVGTTLAFQHDPEFRGYFFAPTADEMVARSKGVRLSQHDYGEIEQSESIVDDIYERMLNRKPDESERKLFKELNNRPRNIGFELDEKKEFFGRVVYFLQQSSSSVTEVSGETSYVPLNHLNTREPHWTLIPEFSDGSITEYAKGYPYVKKLVDSAFKRFSKTNSLKKATGAEIIYGAIDAFYDNDYVTEEMRELLKNRLSSYLLKYYSRYKLRLDPQYPAVEDLVWAIGNSTEFVTIP